jgi:predicted secreted acid phosphatase
VVTWSLTDIKSVKYLKVSVFENHNFLYKTINNSDVFENKNNDKRKAKVDKLKAEFGEKFIVLPNPIYGDWEPGLADNYWGLDEEGKSEARQDALKKWVNN